MLKVRIKIKSGRGDSAWIRWSRISTLISAYILGSLDLDFPVFSPLSLSGRVSGWWFNACTVYSESLLPSSHNFQHRISLKQKKKKKKKREREKICAWRNFCVLYKTFQNFVELYWQNLSLIEDNVCWRMFVANIHLVEN